MLDEKGMVAALKAAYKGGGYKAAFAEGKVMLRCGVSLDEELDAWDQIKEQMGMADTPIRRTRVQLDGCEIWQTGAGLRARPMDPDFTRIIDEEGIKLAFVRMEDGAPGKEIFFKGFAERAVICGKTYQNNPGLARIEGFPWLGEGGA